MALLPEASKPLPETTEPLPEALELLPDSAELLSDSPERLPVSRGTPFQLPRNPVNRKLTLFHR